MTSALICAAQGSMANLAMIIDAAKSDRADVLVTFQPQTLYAAIQRAPEIKKVFSIMVEPFMAGAGETDARHRPNLTGFYYSPNYPKLLAAAKACQPGLQRIGTLYAVGDREAELGLAKLRQAAEAENLTLVAQAYTGQLEIPEAAKVLSSKNVDAILIAPNPYRRLGFRTLPENDTNQIHSETTVGRPPKVVPQPVVCARLCTVALQLPLKTSALMRTPGGIVILVRPPWAKAMGPIFVTLSGRTTRVTLLQPKNAERPISVTGNPLIAAGTVTVVSLSLKLTPGPV